MPAPTRKNRAANSEAQTATEVAAVEIAAVDAPETTAADTAADTAPADTAPTDEAKTDEAKTDEAKTDEAKTDEAKTDENAKPEENDPWAALPPPEAVTYTRGPLRKDLEKETPDVIKRGLQASFDGYKPGKDGKAGTPLWMSQKLPTEKMAEEFIKLAKSYGKFRDWTVRAAVLPTDKTTVRFSAKKRETRDAK